MAGDVRLRCGRDLPVSKGSGEAEAGRAGFHPEWWLGFGKARSLNCEQRPNFRLPMKEGAGCSRAPQAVRRQRWCPGVLWPGFHEPCTHGRTGHNGRERQIPKGKYSREDGRPDGQRTAFLKTRQRSLPGEGPPKRGRSRALTYVL